MAVTSQTALNFAEMLGGEGQIFCILCPLVGNIKCLLWLVMAVAWPVSASVEGVLLCVGLNLAHSTKIVFFLLSGPCIKS